MGAVLPAGLVAYKRTPVFDQDSLPAGLRRRHRTRAGVWALIHVVEGALRFRSFDPAEETVLFPGRPAAVGPEQAHEVEPLGPLRMFVEFHATPQDAGARLPPRGERV